MLVPNNFGDPLLGIGDILVFEELVLRHESVLGFNLVFLFLNNLFLRESCWVNLLILRLHFQFVRNVLMQILKAVLLLLVLGEELLGHRLAHILSYCHIPPTAEVLLATRAVE